MGFFNKLNNLFKDIGNVSNSNSSTITPSANYTHNTANIVDTNIALELFDSQCLGGVTSKKTQQILALCKNREEILLKAIEFCGVNPTDAKQLYIASHCYVWLGAKYRTQAIEYLNKYISVGASWSGTPKGIMSYGNYTVNQLDASKASVYHYLGKAYEGEYDFENAEIAYANAEKLEPYFATYSVCIANTYIKRNELPKALQYLQGKKQTPYYKNDINDYKLLLGNALSDVLSKIEKGYVYKPRKKKNIVSASS